MLTMRPWKCVQSVAFCLLGFVVLLVVHDPQNAFSDSDMEFNATKTQVYQDLKTNPTTPIKQRFSLRSDKDDNFASVYVRSLFCHRGQETVPLNMSKPKLSPSHEVLRGAEVVVLVISSHSHWELRQVIRRTWANNTLGVVGVVFVLGSHWDNYWNSFIEEEHKQHGDILQVMIQDTYRNLTDKVLTSFRWLIDSLPEVKYLIKSDDDVYLYLPNVLNVIRNMSADVIVGAYCPHSVVSRNTKDDWGVTKVNYRPDFFPPYVAGGSYLMSAHVTKSLLRSWPTCRKLQIEDVFITGILAVSAQVNHQPHSGFSFWGSSKARPCDMVKGRVNSVNMSIKQLMNLHKGILDIGLKLHVCVEK